jgi:predicted transposase/invertase (TIGR01784 family)
MENTDILKTGRQYKDTLFRTLFSDSQRFLELYNAVEGCDYPEDTPVTPCPSNSLLARFNDLAACIGSQLVVFFEHQSTLSKNMALRLLPYAADTLYTHIVDKDKLYGNTRVIIPTPKFYVLYNGEQRLESRVLKLSDSFVMEDPEPSLELTAKIIDINYDSGEAALGRSSSLQGYAMLIAEVRKNLHTDMARDEAIVAAINDCIDQGILQTFLHEHYGEVAKMLNNEYDAEAERRVLRQEGKQEGRQEGKQEGLQEGVDMLAKLLLEGIPLEEALEKAKKSANVSS